jgi:hypothetical protein
MTHAHQGKPCRGKDCVAGNATPKSDMPVFVVKAKDRLALATLIEYHRLCIGHGLIEQACEVSKAMLEIHNWQRLNPQTVKMPDHKHEPVN